MHQRLSSITIMQCIVGNPMQIVLWKVMLNYLLGGRKKKAFAFIYFNRLFFGFQSSCQWQ